MTENEKHELQFNIKRDSLEDKAKDLLVWAESVHKNLEYRVSYHFCDEVYMQLLTILYHHQKETNFLNGLFRPCGIFCCIYVYNYCV